VKPDAIADNIAWDGKELMEPLTMDSKNEVLEEIKQRTEYIPKLENSIREISEIHFYLGLLISSQGDSLDNIDLNVQQAAEHVNKANKKLRDAAKKKRRTWWRILLSLFFPSSK
ncbi:hypothetical protein PMAYCL1PPCAC_19526, partial [Pristionchus mayeri]